MACSPRDDCRLGYGGCGVDVPRTWSQRIGGMSGFRRPRLTGKCASSVECRMMSGITRYGGSRVSSDGEDSNLPLSRTVAQSSTPMSYHPLPMPALVAVPAWPGAFSRGLMSMGCAHAGHDSVVRRRAAGNANPMPVVTVRPCAAVSRLWLSVSMVSHTNGSCANRAHRRRHLLGDPSMPAVVYGRYNGLLSVVTSKSPSVPYCFRAQKRTAPCEPVQCFEISPAQVSGYSTFLTQSSHYRAPLRMCTSTAAGEYVACPFSLVRVMCPRPAHFQIVAG